MRSLQCFLIAILGITAITSHAENVSWGSEKVAVIYVSKRPQVPVANFGVKFLAQILPVLKQQRSTVFRNVPITILMENSSGNLNRVMTEIGNAPRTYEGLRQLMESQGLPPPQPYTHPGVPALDIVISMTFHGVPNAEQQNALHELKSMFQDIADVSVSLSKRHVIFDRGTGTSNDEYMAFLVPWKPDMNPAASQDRWLRHHGPLAAQLISQHAHPGTIKKYQQIHTDLEQPNDSTFDKKYQGICFENINAVSEIALEALNDPKTMQTSQTLAIDEYSFSEGPSLIFFTRLRW